MTASQKQELATAKSRTQYHQYLNGKLIYCHCLLSKSDISLYIQIHCMYIYIYTHEASQGRIEYQYNIAIPIYSVKATTNGVLYPSQHLQ